MSYLSKILLRTEGTACQRRTDLEGYPVPKWVQSGSTFGEACYLVFIPSSPLLTDDFSGPQDRGVGSLTGCWKNEGTLLTKDL